MVFKILLIIFIITGRLSVFQALLKLEDESFHGFEADRFDWSKHPCNRPCTDNVKPKLCHYRFVIERFTTMSKACYNCPRNISDCYRPHCLPGNGFRKIVYTVDRKLPGPYIQVCLNDIIVVDVKNMMQAAVTTIHWHGIRQFDTPYMDGVPFVTQCPILPQSEFRYQFKADQSGTYFWHSHLGGQRVDGLVGALTIRSPQKLNPHRNLYDFDNHSMVITNWNEHSEDDFYTTISQVGPETVTLQMIQINGLGRYQNLAKSDEEPVYVPSAVFTVKQGFRYRFRLINAGATLTTEMSIDNHTMLIISSDGNDIDPIEVNSIYTWPGERYDFVINANQKIDNYWFRYRLRDDTSAKVYQVAILRYETAALEDPKSPVDWDIMQSTQKLRLLNPFLPFKSSPLHEAIKMTSSLAPNDKLTNEHVDYQFYLGFNLNPINEYEFHRSNIYEFNQVKAASFNVPIGTFQFNHISFTMPHIPVLSQRNMITPGMLCNSTSLIGKNCEQVECTCTHTLQVKLNSIVEMIIIDEGGSTNFNHPMHLHGHFFRVIASEQLEGLVTVDRVKQLDREGKIKRTLNQAPLKDTVMVPKSGYSIIRFYADNPGYWLLHCHFDPHTELGLALIFKVGEHEDMLPVPKNFPRCGNYKPSTMQKS